MTKKRRFDRIRLDMDGVLADFHSAAALVHGRSEIHRNNWPMAGKELMRNLGLDPEIPDHYDLFWAPIRSHDTFWHEVVEPFEWCLSLVELCKQYTGPNGVSIITGPASGTEAEHKGKMAWLAKHGVNLEVVFEKEKWKHSEPGCLLIDDWEVQVDKFNAVENGGSAVLFPQPWGRLHFISRNPISYIEEFLKYGPSGL